uniref:Uncharacterized protein n=1 Tax=Nelumbo nucifera TaxID=4432 RepID=A0A822XT81_NELNU|nr:TPA_asm: hypothetical protein HUJ06_024685 [Nelumbo nucifera]
MALCIGTGGVCRSGTTTGLPFQRKTLLPFPSNISYSSSSRRKRNAHIVCARKISSRTGRFDSKNKKSGGLTTTREEDVGQKKEGGVIEDDVDDTTSNSTVDVDDGYFLPELPGDKPDFWEGPQWDALGFFVQYMWAFGIVFALIACGIAVATYNEGATDFKQTPVYKESIQSRELLEEPEAKSAWARDHHIR